MKKLLFFMLLCFCAIWSNAQNIDTITINGHEAVNLGLPSGTKWATCNVGATNPEEYGDYFAWGETAQKSNYVKRNYKYYGESIDCLQGYGVIDTNGNLTAKYDAATVNWGSKWHIPTKAQIQELRDKCDWEWTTRNGIEGYLVTGPSENSIFLPAAGYRDGPTLYNAGSYGYYWSSTAYEGSNYAYYLLIGSSNYDLDSDYRYYGQSVRPVSE